LFEIFGGGGKLGIVVLGGSYGVERPTSYRMSGRWVKSKDALEAGELERFGRLMDVHWEHKKRRSSKMSNDDIDRWYTVALDHGMLGDKVDGVGGGGFLMLYANDGIRLRAAMRESGLQEVGFRFDFEGTEVIAQS
jgi:D-glycero-alpha-D-manno-heptose-7-phosphate kinase